MANGVGVAEGTGIAEPPSLQDRPLIKVPIDELHKQPRKVMTPYVKEGKSQRIIFGRENSARKLDPSAKCIEVTGNHPTLSRDHLALDFKVITVSGSPGMELDVTNTGANQVVLLTPGGKVVVLDSTDPRRRQHGLQEIRGTTLLMRGNLRSEIISLTIPGNQWTSSAEVNKGVRAELEVGVATNMDRYAQAIADYKAGKSDSPNGGLAALRASLTSKR